MPKLAKLKKELGASLKKALNPEPLWKGPYSDDRNGGLTYSLLSRFMVCRHKFWIKTIKGLRQSETFDNSMEYGNAWHVCEENLAAGKDYVVPLKAFCTKLSGQYPLAGNEIVKLFNCCKVQFPLYVRYWSKQKDVAKRKPLGQEEVFKVQYTLPDGRKIWLRGKFDSRDLIDKKQYWQENKTKSDIKVDQLKTQLPFDLQSMTYVIAGELHDPSIPVGGVRYNCIRRPLSGQKYNIRQREGRGAAKAGAETDAEFYARLGTVIEEESFDDKGNPKEHSDFFVRFRVDVTKRDIERFKQMVLNPWLTQLCDWWDSIEGDPFNPWVWCEGSMLEGLPNSNHFLFPSGVYNPALEGRIGAIDELINGGNEREFHRAETLFPELEV